MRSRARPGLPCRGQLVAALCFQARRELACGTHCLEDGNRIVSAAHGEESARACVLDRGNVGAQRDRLIDEDECVAW